MPKTLNAKTFSFDVFDTCITRYCAQPADLFEPLFIRLLADKVRSVYALETAAKALARSRIQAEQATRDGSTRDDITLAEIYQTLSPSLKPYDITPEQAAAEEIELELSAVSPIVSTQRRVQQLRSQGHPIIFISDMYLPGSVIRQMLIEHGFTNGEDSVYVSSDTGLSKGSGWLFTYACGQHGLKPKQLHHTGDSLYADIRGAQQLGIQTTFFTQGAPNRYETGFRSELIDNDWVRSHLVGISRAVRLRHAPGTPEGDHHAAIAADILAPLLTSYVSWVLITAQQAGIEHLYFADTGLLAIAQIIAQSWKKYGPKHGIPKNGIPKNGIPQLNGYKQLNDSTPPSSHKHLPNWAISGAFSNTGEPPTNHSYKHESLYFTLLNAGEPALDNNHPKTHLAYLEAPIGPRKLPEGTLYLFEYRQMIALLLSVPSGHLFPSYRAIVLDYAAAFARSQALTGHLDMLKRYATRNVICFLAEPQLTDVQALIDLQTARGTARSKLVARPVRPSEIPAFGRYLLKGSGFRANPSATSNRWIEGSMLLSPQLIQRLLKSIRQLYRYLAPQKMRWFR